MQENNNQNPEIELDENKLIQIRKEKLKELQEQGYLISHSNSKTYITWEW